MKSCIDTAKPHTIKKFELIEEYVDGWARKLLGYDASKGVIFIDCMCNCGIYFDENKIQIDGTAIRVAKKLNEVNEKHKKDVKLYFNDFSSEKVEVLKAELQKYELSNIQLEYSTGDANTYLKRFNLCNFQNHNTLLFYDPYNAMVDWEAVDPFLNRWGEVIINHMVSDAPRAAKQAKKESEIKRYEALYRKKIDELIQIGNDKVALEEIIQDIIIEQTKDFPNKRYIASFPFYIRTNQLAYNLIHCSANAAGFNLFKKSAWKVFGGQSASKRTKGIKGQFVLDTGSGEAVVSGTAETDGVYTVYDMANYIFNRYNAKGEIPFDAIYEDLANHPIFPCEGYRKEMKEALSMRDGVTIKKSSIVFG